MDNPEGQVTYPDKQDGRATYRLWYVSIHTLRFCLCILYNQAASGWINNLSLLTSLIVYHVILYNSTSYFACVSAFFRKLSFRVNKEKLFK